MITNIISVSTITSTLLDITTRFNNLYMIRYQLLKYMVPAYSYIFSEKVKKKTKCNKLIIIYLFSTVNSVIPHNWSTTCNIYAHIIHTSTAGRRGEGCTTIPGGRFQHPPKKMKKMKVLFMTRQAFYSAKQVVHWAKWTWIKKADWFSGEVQYVKFDLATKKHHWNIAW